MRIKQVPRLMTVKILFGCEGRTVLCWICGECVTLEDCKVDENGQAVHEECYMMVVLRRPAPSQNAA